MKYRELLPEYLEGNNINAHANVIEDQDNTLNNMITVLQNVLSLEQIILYKDQHEVIINAPFNIDQVIIINENGVEEKTQYTNITFNLEIQKEYNINEVKIISDDGITITKKYTHNNKALDYIGNLLGVNRLQNEQDYNYLSRLKYFITSRETTELIPLMYHIRTNHELTDDFIISNMIERVTSLTEQIKKLVGTNITTFSSKGGNINDIETIIKQYGIITRQYQALPEIQPELVIDSWEYPTAPNGLPAIKLQETNGNGIYNAPIDVYKENTKIYTMYTDKETAKIPIVPYGSKPDDYHPSQVTWKYGGEYEINETTLTHEGIYLQQPVMLLQDKIFWNYKVNPDILNPVAPFNEGETINAGKGYYVYTPLVDVAHLDLSNYGIYASFMGYDGSIGLMGLVETDEGISIIEDLTIPVDAHGDGEAHELFINFVDGKIFICVDSKLIKQISLSEIRSDLLYFAMINTSELNQYLKLEYLQIGDGEPMQIYDDCTTNVNWYPSRLGLPTVATVGKYTCLNGVSNTNEHSIHKQMCIYRYSNSTLEFDIYLASNYGIFGLASLELLSNGRLNKNVLQYVPSWNHYGNENGNSHSGGSISKNTWHHIRWETENQITKCYTDDTLTYTYNWGDYSTVTEFNDYLFLFLQRIYATDNVYMKNIILTSNHLVQGSELENVLARYEEQYQ